MKLLVVTSTFPQWAGDPRGRFLLGHWEARARRGDRVRVLAPRTAWVRGALASAFIPTFTARLALEDDPRRRAAWRLASSVANMLLLVSTALAIVAVGLLPIYVLARQITRGRAVSGC